jgi:hypothetical protein
VARNIKNRKMRCDCVKVRKKADRYRRGVIRVKRGRLDDSWIDPLYWIDNNPLRIIEKKMAHALTHHALHIDVCCAINQNNKISTPAISDDKNIKIESNPFLHGIRRRRCCCCCCCCIIYFVIAWLSK